MKYIAISNSKKFSGHLIFEYDDNQQLILYQNCTDMSEKNLNYMFAKFPFTRDALFQISPNLKIEEVIDITFNNFWNTYDKKINKKRCQELWERISASDKQVCLSKINKYKSFCKANNRIAKDPDTYLRNRSWEDELY